MIYVDTNYWIYWLDSRLPEHNYVRKVMNEAISNGLTSNYITLLEVAHHIRNLPRKEFLQLIDSIQSLSTLTMSQLDSETANLALELLPDLATKGLAGRDCIIIAAMQLAGVRTIATHDHAFKEIRWIKVIDTIPSEV